jgi:hypothetical protein
MVRRYSFNLTKEEAGGPIEHITHDKIPVQRKGGT